MVNVLTLILFVVAFEAAAQYCLKKCNKTDRWIYYFLGLGFYALVSLALLFIYNESTMGSANVLWSGLSILAITSIGFFIYNEKITWYDILGALLVIAGIGLIYIKDHV